MRWLRQSTLEPERARQPAVSCGSMPASSAPVVRSVERRRGRVAGTADLSGARRGEPAAHDRRGGRCGPSSSPHQDPQTAAARRLAPRGWYPQVQVFDDRGSGAARPQSSAPDVLLAYQPVGPNVGRVCRLVQTFPATRFSVLVDDPGIAGALGRAATDSGVTSTSWSTSTSACRGQASSPALRHFRCTVRSHRRRACARPDCTRTTDTSGIPIRLCGRMHAIADSRASPRFARRFSRQDSPFLRSSPGERRRSQSTHSDSDVECSPGTCVLLGRGLQHDPSRSRFSARGTRADACRAYLRSAIASVWTSGTRRLPPRTRIRASLFLNLEGATAVGHSEEHLVVTIPGARPVPGTAIYGVPWHICPTVALHSEAVVIDNGRADARWRVTGRERHLTV